MKKFLLSTLASSAILACSYSAFAASAPCASPTVSNPWYVGVGINYPGIQEDNVFSSGLSFKQDTKKLGGNVFVGYTVNHYFRTELGFNYLGDIKYRIRPGTRRANFDNLWDINFVGQAFLPVTSWFNPYIFAGVAYTEMNIRVQGVSPLRGDQIQGTFDSFAAIYGAGLQFNINQFGIRVSYTRIDTPSSILNLGDANPSNIYTRKNFISLDVLYRFAA